MAKVVGPLFSLEARGALGEALVYFPWKGTNAVRQWTKPTNPRDIDQQIVRQKLSLAGKNVKFCLQTQTDLVNGSGMYQALKEDAPATLPWNAHFVKNIMNRIKADADFTADSAALFAVSETELTTWHCVAIELGFETLTGDEYATTISPELQLFCGARAGYDLDLSGEFIDMSTLPSEWAAAQISEFGSEYETVA